MQLSMFLSWVSGLFFHNLWRTGAYVGRRRETAPSNLDIQVMFAGMDLDLIESL